jgi:hypothetical protein
LITQGQLFVTGDVRVRHTILAASSSDHRLTVGGEIHASTILDYGHTITAAHICANDILLFNHISDNRGPIDGNLMANDVVAAVRGDNESDIGELQSTVAYIKQGGTAFRISTQD